jgi:predicted N-acetyltransferase YhbS
MVIRPEAPPDYPAIAAVHARAFGNRAIEPAVVALRRQYTSFDPGLSLVAELDGRVVGHVLFFPEKVRLLGGSVAAVNLAPIAVDPAHQGKGVGGALIEEGHAIARTRGFHVAFLLGHPSYYSRFGYQPRAFGAASAVVSAAPGAASALHARPPAEPDIPALRALWEHEEGAVDFAIDPGPDLLCWLSPNPAVQAFVYTRAGEIVGYARMHTREPLAPKQFLARDPAAALAVAGQIAHRAGGGPGSELVLPLHPASGSGRAFGTAGCEAWAAGMAYGLCPGSFDEYYAQVQAGRRIPGAPVWPVVFDLA